MSASKTMTLTVGNRKVRTAVGKTYHVAVDADGEKLKVTKRTNSLDAARAEVRRLHRVSGRSVYVFKNGELERSI